MSALPRPDLPPGPRRELSDALHDLHHRAGWPSLRALARETGVSHTTISKTLSAPTLPTWGTLELLVEALGGDIGRVHELWLAASSPDLPTDRSVTPARIAGRKTELAAVRRHLEIGTGLLLVSGEAGIGKTTLVQAAIGSVDPFVPVGRCLPLATEVPLMPIIDVLSAIHDVDDGTWLKDALLDTPSFTARSLARLLPHLSGETPPVSTDEYARQHLFTAVAKVLTQLASLRPLALAAEDLHWADPTTLDLLEHVVGRSIAAPIVGTWRTEDDATPRPSLGWFDRMQRLSEVSVLKLGPLTRDETAEQLALLGSRLPERLDSIHSRSLGQPLFTEQLAAHLDGDPGLPDRLAELLDHRLEGLTEPAWIVLRTLGLAERPLPPAQLAAAGALTPEQLTAQLHELRIRRLIRPSAEDAVHLQHPLLAEAAQRRLVPGEAIGVHRALAMALGTGSGASAAEVANHWRSAGDVDREVEWRVRAARASAAAFDWSGAAAHWLRILELWTPSTASVGDPPITRPLVYLAAMDALNESLQLQRAAAMSDAAEAELGEVDDATRAELLVRAADYRGDREGMTIGLALIDEALEIFAGLPASAAQLRALNQKRLILEGLGRYDEGKAVVRTAISIAQTVGDRRLHRHNVISLAWHEGAQGAISATFDLLEQARSLVSTDTDPMGDIRSGVIATDVLLMCGSPLRDVEEAARPALEVARAWSIDHTLSMMLAANLATARLRAGRVQEADTLIAVGGDQPPDGTRWPLEELRAAVDARKGHLDEAADRIHFIVSEICIGDEIDLETLCEAADIDFWHAMAHLMMPRLRRDLETIVDSAPVRTFLPALVMAARGAAEAATSHRPGSDAEITHVRDLVSRTSHRIPRPDERDPHIQAHLATAEAETFRAEDRLHIDQWARAAAAWDVLGRPHDAAYCRWRGAQAAFREGQGTLAIRLLKRAKAGARYHVPLSTAIATTSAAV